MKRKMMSWLLLCAILISNLVIPINACAANAEIKIPVTITEKNGISVSDYLTRRGVALEKGSVYDYTELVLKDDSGNEIPFTAEPMQYYDDGSIQWLKFAVSADLKPNEIKRMYITNGKRAFKSAVTCTQFPDHIQMSNDAISLRMGYRGIESITYQNKELLAKSGLNVYAEVNGSVQSMKGTEFEIVQESDLYVKARVFGAISDTVQGEICVTLSYNSEWVDMEYRINTLQNETIRSTGMMLRDSSQPVGVVTEDFVNIGSMTLISTDNSKFRGAVSKREDTGFISDGSTIKIAPIVNNTDFMWYDGVTRTNHLYLSLGKNGEGDYKTISNPPECTVSAEQFVAAGVISDTEIPSPTEKMISALHWASDKLDGRFEAGSIPYDIDVEANLCSSYGTRNGEMEFYLSYGYMMSEDPLLYSMITDSAESWADVVIYKGGMDEIYGANRYRTGEQYGGDRFFTSHPYYGDLSGLYMAYMISGNEYLERVFKAAVDYIYKNMYIRTNAGEHYPRRVTWSGERVSYSTEAESRYLIQARGLYLAYQLYGDEKYRQAAQDIVGWADKTQTDRGFWYQAYHDDGRAYVQSKQLMPAAKNYIYLYGIRGILEMFEYEQTDQMKKVIDKCADFLCSENETFGPGIWHPFGDADEYEVNEDNTRGKSPMSDIMAVDVLYCAYKITGEERYFENILSLLDVWLCAQTPGGSAAHKIGTEGYSLQIANTVGQNLTLLRHCSELKKLIDERQDSVIQLGYTGVAAAFGAESKPYNADITVNRYSYPEITVNAYESERSTAIMGMNVTGSSSGDFEKELELTVNDAGLWQGMRNRIHTPNVVTLCEKTSQFDCFHALKRPIYVTELAGAFEAEISEYNSEKIEIALYGADAASFRIESGEFEITGETGYTVTSLGTKIMITKGGNVKATPEHTLEFTIGADSKEEVARVWLKQQDVSLTDGTPSGQVLNRAAQKILGMDLFPNTSQPICNSEAYGAVLKKLAVDYPEKLRRFGVEGMEIAVPAIPKNDEDAVKLAAQELQIAYDGDMLSSDVELVREFLYDTRISWSSSNEKVLSDTGVLSRSYINNDDTTVTLTATIRKNSAETTKEFVIPLKPKEKINWRTKVAFNDCKFSIIPQTEQFEICFTVVPDKEKVNALVGLTEGALGVSAMSQLAVIVRFNPDGYIDAYNKTTYAAESAVPYSGNKAYSFRLEVRPETQDFDVYVTPEGEEEKTLGIHYGFRLSAPSPGVIDTMYLPAAIEDNCFSLIDNSLAAYQKQPKTEQSQFGARFGLSYGRFVIGKVYLPPVSDDKKLSWVTDPPGRINDFNLLSEEQNSGTAMLYRVESNAEGIHSVTDIAKIIGIADREWNETEYLTAEQAVRLLRGICYFYE